MDTLIKLLNIEIFHLNDATVTPMTLILATAIFSLGFWLSTHSRRLLNTIMHMRFRLPRGIAFAISTIVFYAVIVASMMISLSVIGFDMRNVAIIAGALSVGIGLGLQAIANNFMSGLLLLFDHSIRVGDYVEIDGGLHGHIEEIRMRSTIIKTNDNVEIIVPNSVFISERVINWTLTDDVKRMRIPFSVANNSDVDHLSLVILALAQQLPHVIADKKVFDPQIWLTKLAEYALDFELIVWVDRIATVNPIETRSLFLCAIHQALRTEGFEAPFPQQDIHIKSGLRQKV